MQIERFGLVVEIPDQVFADRLRLYKKNGPQYTDETLEMLVRRELFETYLKAQDNAEFEKRRQAEDAAKRKLLARVLALRGAFSEKVRQEARRAEVRARRREFQRKVEARITGMIEEPFQRAMQSGAAELSDADFNRLLRSITSCPEDEPASTEI